MTEIISFKGKNSSIHLIEKYDAEFPDMLPVYEVSEYRFNILQSCNLFTAVNKEDTEAYNTAVNLFKGKLSNLVEYELNQFFFNGEEM